MPQFSGVYVAAVTPHRREGHEADFAAMLELVDFLSRSGVQGIALLGSTGEFVHIKAADRSRLVHLAVKRSRVPIIANVSHSTLDGALELASDAINSGVEGMLLMPPFFFRYEQEDIFEFYRAFANAVGTRVPVLLYNIPQFTNKIELDTAARLFALGRFAGIKDSSGDVEYFTRLLQLPQRGDLAVLVGNDTVFTRLRPAGADGVISGVACAVPELLVALDQALRENRTEQIAALQTRLQEFIAWIDRFPTPVGVKVATAVRGFKVGPVAMPLSKEKTALLEEFKAWFKAWLPVVQKASAHA